MSYKVAETRLRLALVPFLVGHAVGICNIWRKATSESGSGTSRHFAALQNLVAIEGIADIEQAAPIKLDEWN
jgi:H+/Cl- antiporter ClcA